MLLFCVLFSESVNGDGHTYTYACGGGLKCPDNTDNTTAVSYQSHTHTHTHTHTLLDAMSQKCSTLTPLVVSHPVWWHVAGLLQLYCLSRLILYTMCLCISYRSLSTIHSTIDQSFYKGTVASCQATIAPLSQAGSQYDVGALSIMNVAEKNLYIPSQNAILELTTLLVGHWQCYAHNTGRVYSSVCTYTYLSSSTVFMAATKTTSSCGPCSSGVLMTCIHRSRESGCGKRGVMIHRYVIIVT